ncbi:hypothetical protein quinque_007653 [Culex quinquefasciatus]
MSVEKSSSKLLQGDPRRNLGHHPYVDFVRRNGNCGRCYCGATGNVSDLANGSWTRSWAYADCAPEKYEYGLHNSFQVMELVSGPIIYAEYAEKKFLPDSRIGKL